MQNIFNSPMGWIWGVLIVVAIFLFLREIVTWYWKFTKMVDLLEKIERNTRPGGVATSTKRESQSISDKILSGFLPGDGPVS